MKWKKWILPNSKISKREKSIISGHYVFSNPKVLEIKEKAMFDLKGKGINLDYLLKKEISVCMKRILFNFRLIR